FVKIKLKIIINDDVYIDFKIIQHINDDDDI
ncbi:unnamed protein product, partial [Rotaria sordida]